MMLNAAARVALMPLRVPQNGIQLISSLKGQGNLNLVRAFKTNAKLFQENERHFVRRAKDRIGLKDRAMGPTSGTPFQIGWLVILIAFVKFLVCNFVVLF